MPNPIALHRWLQQIHRCIFDSRQLVLLRPSAHLVEVATLMHRVEVDKSLYGLPLRLVPDLAEHADINRAHELLAKSVEAVGCQTISF